MSGGIGGGGSKTPADFLKSIRAHPVVVKLNSGVDYRGILACLDGYMNIAMEQTEEYVNGQLKNKYGDAFIRGNNACNTVVPTRVSRSASGQLDMQAASAGEVTLDEIEYQGESPDEQALVSAAAAHGYTLVERSSAAIVINVFGETQRYELLGIHEFDSVRKRMSVVVQCPDKTIKVLLKGADATVLDIVRQPDAFDLPDNVLSTEKLEQVWDSTINHLDVYARAGLRTLVIASRDLGEIELENWQFKYQEASVALIDCVDKLREVANVVEHSLTLIGATGIEDKLQEGVPETIASLREAGMKLWVLTSDKQETAISIG